MTRREAAFAWLVLAVATTTANALRLEFNDPLAPRQYYHDQMRFGEAWGLIQSQPKRGQVTVAVLDSGFQTDHPDLPHNGITGINIVDGSTNVSPVHPHGTATAGILGARSGNANGISQSALTARVLPIRITNRADGAAYVSDIERSIRYAADHDARVINISYDGVANRDIARAARYAYKQGALVFMAAGNSGHKTRWKNYRHLLAVVSINENSQRSSFSTYGRFVDFVAPGEDIATLHTESGYEDWNGTSFSSPIAASVASLVLTANPRLSPKQVLRIMKKTAITLGTDMTKRERRKEFGYGLPDAMAAVELALETRSRPARRYRRAGIDPYIVNDFSGVLGLESLAATIAPQGGSLFKPQGFLTRRSAGTAVVPEPASLAILLAGALFALHRSRRVTIN